MTPTFANVIDGQPVETVLFRVLEGGGDALDDGCRVIDSRVDLA